MSDKKNPTGTVIVAGSESTLKEAVTTVGEEKAERKTLDPNDSFNPERPPDLKTADEISKTIRPLPLIDLCIHVNDAIIIGKALHHMANAVEDTGRKAGKESP